MVDEEVLVVLYGVICQCLRAHTAQLGDLVGIPSKCHVLGLSKFGMKENAELTLSFLEIMFL